MTAPGYVFDAVPRHARGVLHPTNRVPEPIEWLTDNGSCYTARDTRAFASDIGLVPLTTPVSSPQSNGIAEALVRTLSATMSA